MYHHEIAGVHHHAHVHVVRTDLVAIEGRDARHMDGHLQRDDAEAFYVLEGHFDFMLAGQTVRSGPGSFHYVPRGVPHGFANNGDAPARMLIINLPGGLHETFFLEAGDAVADASAFPPPSPPDMPRLMQAAMRAGIEMLPPA